jgi:hypothetical protein
MDHLGEERPPEHSLHDAVRPAALLEGLDLHRHIYIHIYVRMSAWRICIYNS